MKLSDSLAQLTHARFQQFSPPFTQANAKPAILAFRGDVYQGLDADSLDAGARDHAQKHLRILSGLYGLLRPFDLMQPYRLEMGTRFRTDHAADLYGFWGDKIAKALNADMKEVGASCLINLASREYVKAVDKKALVAPMITLDFREMRDGEARMIGFFAKKARGVMARFIAENRLTKPADLKEFSVDGYEFAPALSDERVWTFLRPDSRAA